MTHEEPPLLATAMAVCRDLMTADVRSCPLWDRILHAALLFLEEIALAFRGVDRPLHLERADEWLTSLRVQVRLAERCNLLGLNFSVHVLRQLDEAGRQIGGWQKKLQ